MKERLILLTMLMVLLVISVNAKELTFPKIINQGSSSSGITLAQNTTIIEYIGNINLSMKAYVDLQIVGGGEYSNFKIENVSNTTTWNNVLNKPALSNYQTTNTSNYLTTNGYNFSVSLNNYNQSIDLSSYLKTYTETDPIFITDTSRYKLTNFTSNYDLRLDRFGNANFTSLFPTSYEAQAYFKITNMSSYLTTNGYNKSIDLSSYNQTISLVNYIKTDDNIKINNITTTRSNNTFGNITTIQINSTCAGFRFGTTGGLLLSCND